jgi:hypothetical protein
MFRITIAPIGLADPARAGERSVTVSVELLASSAMFAAWYQYPWNESNK